eukprot:gene4811-34565_t
MGAIGDLAGNIARLVREMKSLKSSIPIDEVGLRLGDPVAHLPLLHFILLKFSRHVACHIANSSFELQGKTDKRFVETAFRLFRDVCQLKSVLTAAQFLEQGYAERKVNLLCDVIQWCKKTHNDALRKERLAALKHRSGPPANLSRLVEPKKTPEVKVVKNNSVSRQTNPVPTLMSGIPGVSTTKYSGTSSTARRAAATSSSPMAPLPSPPPFSPPLSSTSTFSISQRWQQQMAVAPPLSTTTTSSRPSTAMGTTFTAARTPKPAPPSQDPSLELTFNAGLASLHRPHSGQGATPTPPGKQQQHWWADNPTFVNPTFASSQAGYEGETKEAVVSEPGGTTPWWKAASSFASLQQPLHPADANQDGGGANVVDLTTAGGLGSEQRSESSFEFGGLSTTKNAGFRVSEPQWTAAAGSGWLDGPDLFATANKNKSMSKRPGPQSVPLWTTNLAARSDAKSDASAESGAQLDEGGQAGSDNLDTTFDLTWLDRPPQGASQIPDDGSEEEGEEEGHVYGANEGGTEWTNEGAEDMMRSVEGQLLAQVGQLEERAAVAEEESKKWRALLNTAPSHLLNTLGKPDIAGTALQPPQPASHSIQSATTPSEAAQSREEMQARLTVLEGRVRFLECELEQVSSQGVRGAAPPSPPGQHSTREGRSPSPPRDSSLQSVGLGPMQYAYSPPAQQPAQQAYSGTYIPQYNSYQKSARGSVEEAPMYRPKGGAPIYEPSSTSINARRSTDASVPFPPSQPPVQPGSLRGSLDRPPEQPAWHRGSLPTLPAEQPWQRGSLPSPPLPLVHNFSGSAPLPSFSFNPASALSKDPYNETSSRVQPSENLSVTAGGDAASWQQSGSYYAPPSQDDTLQPAPQPPQPLTLDPYPSMISGSIPGLRSYPDSAPSAPHQPSPESVDPHPGVYHSTGHAPVPTASSFDVVGWANNVSYSSSTDAPSAPLHAPATATATAEPTWRTSTDSYIGASVASNVRGSVSGALDTVGSTVLAHGSSLDHMTADTNASLAGAIPAAGGSTRDLISSLVSRYSEAQQYLSQLKRT